MQATAGCGQVRSMEKHHPSILYRLAGNVRAHTPSPTDALWNFLEPLNESFCSYGTTASGVLQDGTKRVGCDSWGGSLRRLQRCACNPRWWREQRTDTESVCIPSVGARTPAVQTATVSCRGVNAALAGKGTAALTADRYCRSWSSRAPMQQPLGCTMSGEDQGHPFP